jgi:hypothetical protein
MAYPVIPQVEFDRAVQRIISIGVGRTPAENIVMSLWKASIDLGLNFKQLLDKATANGKLVVEQSVLDHINLNLPGTIRYNTKTAAQASSIATREL